MNNRVNALCHCLAIVGLCAFSSGELTAQDTDLLSAVKAGNTALVTDLIAKGADVNASDTAGLTPLVSAAIRSDTAMIKMLLDKGADINAFAPKGSTALRRVAGIAGGGRDKIVSLLLIRGADINAKSYLGQTALHAAAYSGNSSTVALLLRRGAVVDAREVNGKTALNRVAAPNKSATPVAIMEIATALLAKGADINASDTLGSTPLMRAAASGQKEIAQLLIKKGADTKATDILGFTALHFAAYYQTNVLPLLLSVGSDVDALTKGNDTPLYAAITSPAKGDSVTRLENISMLIAGGANIFAKTTQGWTPLDAARTSKEAGFTRFFEDQIMTKGSPRTVLTQIVAALRAKPTDSITRALVIRFGSRLDPAIALPAEAETFEGRGEYAFKSAKSEKDLVEAAREYLKAIDVAPWVAGYYYNLCVILDKANQPEAAVKACALYVAGAPEAGDAGEVRKLVAGLDYAIQRERAGVTTRETCAEMRDMYMQGGKVATIGDRTISMKLYSALEGGVWKNWLGIYDITTFPNGIFGQRFGFEARDAIFALDDRTPGNALYRLVIGDDGSISFGGMRSSPAEILTSTSEIEQLRTTQLGHCQVAVRSLGITTPRTFFVQLGQGGSLGSNNRTRFGGGLYFASDCHGTLSGDRPGKYPAIFVPHPESPGVTAAESSATAQGLELAESKACMYARLVDLGWLTP